jgi:hypothetical protein
MTAEPDDESGAGCAVVIAIALISVTIGMIAGAAYGVLTLGVLLLLLVVIATGAVIWKNRR